MVYLRLPKTSEMGMRMPAGYAGSSEETATVTRSRLYAKTDRCASPGGVDDNRSVVTRRRFGAKVSCADLLCKKRGNECRPLRARQVSDGARTVHDRTTTAMMRPSMNAAV